MSLLLRLSLLFAGSSFFLSFSNISWNYFSRESYCTCKVYTLWKNGILEHSRKMYMATIGHYSRGSMICFYLRKSHVFKYYLSIIWTQFYCKRKSLYLIVSFLFIDCRLQLFFKKIKTNMCRICYYDREGCYFILYE